MAEFSVPGSGGGPSGPRAGFGVRFVAALVDGVALGVASLLLQALVGEALGTVVGIALGLGYYAYLEGSPSGQTLGKRAMNIRVVDFLTGGPIDPGRALIRYLGRILSTLPCLLGYFWMLWDPERQTWHDKLANTVVVPTSAYPVESWPG